MSVEGNMRGSAGVKSSYNSMHKLTKVKKIKEITEHELKLEPLCHNIVIAFTYRRKGKLISCKYRDLAKHFWQESDTEKILYGLDDIEGASDVIIVEGEMDKLAMEEAGFRNCVSVPDGDWRKLGRMNSSGIFTVEEFLRLVARDSQKLRNILGSGMSNKMWEALIEHKAYDNWSQVVEYDGKSLVSFKQPKRSSVPRNDYSMGSKDYQRSTNQLLPPRRPGVVPSDSASVDSNLLLGGYNDTTDNMCRTELQLVNTNVYGQYDINFVSNGRPVVNSQQIQNTGYDSRSGLALGPPQLSSSSSFQHVNTSIQQQPNMNPFDDWSHNSRDKGVGDFMSEEICMRSHEMLENEDMQHLLRLFSMGGGHSGNVAEDRFSFPSFMQSPAPNFDFDDDRSWSGKAVIGWLKIKAAMRWGFFVRKKAAERRAQIVELDNVELNSTGYLIAVNFRGFLGVVIWR